jgi:NodT family efflux transporter outer membrane factor (OMF) lipoprotein
MQYLALRRIVGSGLVAGLVLAVAGCAPSGKVSGPAVRLPASYELATRPTSLPPELEPAWWSVFGDPQLDTLEAEALARAPDAHTSMARLTEAYAIRSGALSAYNPQGALNGQASDAHNRTTYSGINVSGLSGGAGGSSPLAGLSNLFLPANETKTYQGGFSVSWELDLFGRRKAARRVANADILAARFDFEAARLSLTANVATSLFQARALAVQLEDARETARITARLAEVGKRKAENGLGSESAAARLAADADTARSEAVRLEALANASRRTLLALIGRGADPTSSLTIEPKLASPPNIPVSAPSELLRRRPDVREAEQRLRSAVGTLTLSRLALLPTLTLNPSAAAQRVEANYISETSIWTLAAGATAPVLDRPRLLAVSRLQRARAQEAASLFEQAVVNAYRDAENGLNQYQADRSRLAMLTDAEARNHFAFTASERAYRDGLIDLTTLLDAERSWRASRSALTALQAGTLNDAVSTIKALGGGWSGAPVKLRE